VDCDTTSGGHKKRMQATGAARLGKGKKEEKERIVKSA
jgi:hypothetical protein